LINCKNLGTLGWNAATRTLTFNSVYPTNSDYLYGGSQIQFTIQPITNPAVSIVQNFVWKSYATLST